MADLSDLEQRIARLEDVAFEGDGLTRAVTRLGLNANALGEALLTVDRNQQRLTRLGQDLEQLQETGARKEDVAAAETRTKTHFAAYRKQVLGRVYAASIFVFALVLAAALAAANYVSSQNADTQMACQQSANTRTVIRNYLRVVSGNSSNDKIKSAAQQVVDLLDKNASQNCGG